MVTIRRLLLREFLVLGSLALVLLVGARGVAELWALRNEATQQAESGLRLLVDGIQRETRDTQSLGDMLALMWQRGELAPDRNAELTLEGLLRQSTAQNLILADSAGNTASAHLICDSYRTRSGSRMDGRPRLMERRLGADGRRIQTALLESSAADPTRSSWYLQTLSNEGPIWSGLHRFTTTSDEGVTYGIRVIDPRSQTEGAVGVDLRLKTLESLMQRYKPTPGSQTYLADEKGVLIDGDELVPSALARAVLEAPEADQRWPLLSVGGHRWLVHRARIAGPRWQLLVAIPVQDLLAKPLRITAVSLGVGCLTLILIALRLASVSHRITHPLTDLSRSSEALLSGHPTPMPPMDIQELAQARSALESASERLKEHHAMELELQRIQRLELVGTMAAGLAHDMKNHLMAIQSQIELAILTAPEGPQAPHLARADEACTRMARLLQDLISFGKPRESISERVNLNALVAETGKMLEHSRGKRMQVEVDLDPASPMVLGDRIQLEQVILNLGFNAKDASHEGGVLSLRSGHSQGEAYLEVADSGTGISQEVKDKLFTPFFSTKSDQGTGLGLPMVASIVKAHGGRITVESEPGHGSIFTVWLPLAKDT